MSAGEEKRIVVCSILYEHVCYTTVKLATEEAESGEREECNYATITLTRAFFVSAEREWCPPSCSQLAIIASQSNDPFRFPRSDICRLVVASSPLDCTPEARFDEWMDDDNDDCPESWNKKIRPSNQGRSLNRSQYGGSSTEYNILTGSHSFCLRTSICNQQILTLQGFLPQVFST